MYIHIHIYIMFSTYLHTHIYLYIHVHTFTFSTKPTKCTWKAKLHSTQTKYSTASHLSIKLVTDIAGATSALFNGQGDFGMTQQPY